LEELTRIEDIGPVVARSIKEFFSREENWKVIEKLHRAGVKLEVTEAEREGPLKGKVFVFTGTLKCCSREKAGEIVEKLGGTFSNTVTSKTTYLVVGEDPGTTKMRRADQLGIRKISEEEFIEMIKDYIDVNKLMEEKRKTTLF